MKQSFKTKAQQGTLSYSVIVWALVALGAIVSVIFYNLNN
jgi:hypothetical protein